MICFLLYHISICILLFFKNWLKYKRIELFSSFYILNFISLKKIKSFLSRGCLKRFMFIMDQQFLDVWKSFILEII